EIHYIDKIYEVDNGIEAVNIAIKYEPDIVLVDLSLSGGLDGFTASKNILSSTENTKIIVLTMHDEEAYIKKAIESDVSGYLLKEEKKKKSVLTTREQGIIRLISLCYTNIEIGEQLHISPRTVEKHKENMMKKLGITETHKLVQYALRNNYVDLL